MKKEDDSVTIRLQCARSFIKVKIKAVLETSTFLPLVRSPYKNIIIDKKIKEGEYFHITERIKKETIRKLSKNRKKSEQKVEEFIKEFNIKLLDKKADEKLANNILEECQAHGIDLHEPDNFHVADFKINDINKVYSQDDAVIDSCKYLGIDSSRLFNFEDDEERKFRIFFKKNHK